MNTLTMPIKLKKLSLAIGSGELKGNGIGHNKVYIPGKHTDFIFATIAEEGGFIAASLIIVLFFLLLYQMAIIGQKAETSFEQYVCFSLMVMYCLQIFQNIGMTIGIMPVKGISLPLLSYGFVFQYDFLRDHIINTQAIQEVYV